MKQFLYLDTDIVNSIIAQSEKGLIQEQSEENGSDKKKGTHISGSMEGSGTAGGSFLKLAKAEANLSLSGELGKEYVSSTTSREIISKVLHDAAFDIAYGYIKPQKLSVGKNDSGEYGDYVELTRVFDFVDMDYLEKLGFEIVRLSPKDAIDNFEQYIADNVTQDTILVSCMAVNNENGFKVNTEKLYRLVKNANSETIVHIDGVQGFCKVTLKGDLISLSGHKIHGFKGIGAMYCADKIRFTPLVYGGGQQKNLRPGTEPTELIASFEAAVKAYPADLTHYSELNGYLRDRLSKMEDVYINSPDNSVYNILSFSVLGVRSEIMLHSLEEKEIYVSSGSACSKGKISSVPDAFGMNSERADSTIRVSFSMETTKEDIDALCDEIENGIARFRRTKKSSRKGNI